MADVAKINLLSGASAYGTGPKPVATPAEKVTGQHEQTLAKNAGVFGAGFPTEITPVTGSPKVGGVEGVQGAEHQHPGLDKTFWTAVKNNFYTQHSAENQPKPEGIYGVDYGVPTTKARNLFVSA